MQADLSNNIHLETKAVKAAINSGEIHWSGRLLMLVLNFIPLVHAACTILALLVLHAGGPVRFGVAIGILYILPALTTRMLLLSNAIPAGHIAIGSRGFFAWWLSFQLQVVFCRFPALEELLRLVPGLYSQWLRLWGAQIGRFTYWAAGTLITDRSFLCIGNDVVFGAGVRLNSHVLDKSDEGAVELLLATVKIGDGVMVGGYSLLTAGTEIVSHEVTRAFLISPPFSVWKDGRRIRTKKIVRK